MKASKKGTPILGVPFYLRLGASRAPAFCFTLRSGFVLAGSGAGQRNLTSDGSPLGQMSDIAGRFGGGLTSRAEELGGFFHQLDGVCKLRVDDIAGGNAATDDIAGLRAYGANGDASATSGLKGRATRSRDNDLSDELLGADDASGTLIFARKHAA